MSASPLKVAERSAAYSNEAEIQPILGTCFDLLATAPGGMANLRALILSLAFRGNLAARQPSDEGADELLVRIRAQKSHAVAQGLIKAKRQQAQLAENAIPYGVPGAWRWAPLEHIALRITDGSHNPPRDSGAGYPMLSSQNVRDGAIDFDNPSRYLSDADFEIENERTQVQSGDVLLTIVASLGRSAVVPEGAPKFALQRSVATVRSPLNPTYLSLFFRSPLSRAYYEKHGKGTAQKGIYLGKLAEMPIPVAPLAEQARIVARVEELMQLCDALEAHDRLQDEQHARLVAALFDALAASQSAHALAENWRRIAAHFDLLLDRPEAVDALEQTILQLAVRGLLVPQDPGDEPASALLVRILAEKDRRFAAGQIKRNKMVGLDEEEQQRSVLPRGWEWASIATLAIVGTGTTPSRTNPAYFSPRTIPWVTSGETGQPFIARTDQGVSDLALKETSLTKYPPGTLIVAMYGQGKTRGQVSELLIEATTNQACAAIVPVIEDAGHRRYLKLFFEKIYDEIRELSAGGAQPNLNIGKVKATQIPLPPLAEQYRIVARVEELRRLCADLRQRLQQSRTTQSRLADSLVSAATQSPAC